MTKEEYEKELKYVVKGDCNGDCISRQAVLDKEVYTETSDGWTGWTVDVNDIKALPPVLPQQEVGWWITKKSDERGEMWPINPKCSECGGEPEYSNTIHNYKFCPYCGVPMQEVEEKE